MVLRICLAGRGDIEKAFVYAIRDLQRAVSKLSDAQKTKYLMKERNLCRWKLYIQRQQM